jgi:carboxyl-terminal processing protease
MPRTVAPLAVLALASVTLAAPRERSPSPEAIAAGEVFARQLGAAAEIVSREYVRPVPTTDLYVAAVGALFDAARQPRPAALFRDLKAAKSEPERLELVKQARADVHGAPELADGRDLITAVSAFTPVLDPHTTLLPNAAVGGTATANAYGFDFEGEAQMVREHPVRSGRSGTALEEPDSGSVPPIPFRVLTVKPGGPAQKAGLRPGDIVREIDGTAADIHGAAKAFAGLHGAGPSKSDPGVHYLVVDRVGDPLPLRLRLERTEFAPESLFGVTRRADNSWDYWLDKERRIAYVRLGPIENESGDQLSELLHDLGDVRGLVFDLRWCPGGYIDPAVQIASTFLHTGLIAKMKYRNAERGDNGELRADGGLIRYKAGDYPLLLLVNGETTGGGELIAAALRDNGRAVVAGTRTFGKASIQWTMSIQGLPGYQFKLTGGMYTRPNGKNLQRFPDSKPSDDWGLRPDPGYELPTSTDLARKLKELHQLYALRPGGSREAMDLDDPAADPQRFRALKLMRTLLDEKK